MLHNPYNLLRQPTTLLTTCTGPMGGCLTMLATEWTLRSKSPTPTQANTYLTN